MHVNRLKTGVVFVLCSTLTAGVCSAASPARLMGSLVGSVADPSGIPQMGAAIKLYDRYEKLVDQALSDASGGFGFLGVAPGIYSVRVSLSSFVPAVRKNIAIQPGMQSVLAINMATLLSSVELVYTSRNPGTLMSDDWKWTLRSSMTTRPVTRILPGIDISDPTRNSITAAMFSGTRGQIRLSAGESANPFTAIGSQPDLGTTFALATSLYGRNQLQFSGNFGYNLNSELPAAGFRTSFSRGDATPEVKLTVQQVGLSPGGGLTLGQQANAPMLRTMSVTVFERMQIIDGLDVDYGASLDSVTYLDRLHYASPFARIRYRIGPGRFDVGYSSGAPPVELLNADADDASLLNDMAALSVLPRISLRDGRAQIQRSQNMEVGYTVDLGSREFSLGAYHEFVRNAALTLSTPDGIFFPMDLLPELSSNSSVFNIGNYSRSGYSAALSQDVTDDLQVTVAVGRGGVLTTDRTELGSSSNPEALRRLIQRGQRMWVRGIVSGVLPELGTRFSGSYEWSDATALTPGHVYLTQRILPETGLNIRLRQPLPRGWGNMRGRLEITAELRNLLAQGYLPITSSDGKRMVLAHFPRALRGGLSFIF